ncbi:zinc-binding dehydrogenase [Planctomicrobium sp. SH527]|uniref:zinc-binding dehydrogenase n=1 Tax=Planctomicrobium sp. SH527 TaxID=3448123 RepID=UPI003F5B52F3
MKAAIFAEPGRIVLEEKPVPHVGPLDALIQITMTTICGTDIHILKGEYPTSKGLTVGHEPVGVIARLGAAVTGYEIGQRVIAGAITPCGHCHFCLDGIMAQCGGKSTGGWRLGNSIDGCQAEYVLIPDAMVNLAPIPDNLTDEEVLMCPDIMSTGFIGVENANIRIGDSVAIFAQGPIGLCATLGARLAGATQIFAVDAIKGRLTVSKELGADVTINFNEADPVQTIREATNGRGVDVAIEALGTQSTFESCMRVLRPGGTLSSLGVYSGKLTLPIDSFAAGLGDIKIVTSLCPGGKERMRRLMNVVSSGRADLRSLVTHHYTLDQIEDAYDLFANQRDGVLKIAITPT